MFKQEKTDFHPLIFGSILFFDTCTLSKIIWPVGLIFKLVLFFINDVLSPFVSLSKINPETSFFSLSAQMIKTSAIGAFVIQFFEPFRIYQSLVSSKFVFMEEGSEPASLSVNPKHPIFSPEIRSGKYSSF